MKNPARGTLPFLFAASAALLGLLPGAAFSQVLQWSAVARGSGSAHAQVGANDPTRAKQALAMDPAGNVVATGVSSVDNYDFKTVKYDAATGAIRWQAFFNGPTNSNDAATAVALDAAGNAFVTGASTNGTVAELKTIKYAAATGAVLWEASFNGGASSLTQGMSAAVDASGNVIVTGTSFASGKARMVTIKYAGASGAVLWQKIEIGSANFDQGYAVVLDASGNAVVMGDIRIGLGTDFRIIKYAAADGSTLWQRTYNSAANGEDVPYAIALDASGNVIVGGESGNGANKDFRILKYAAADGTLAWDRFYNGPANGDDTLYGLALDAAGNAIVTGSSSNGSNRDFKTLKLSAADGSLLWEKTLAGPIDTPEDFAYAVAVDAAGNAIVAGSNRNFSTLDDMRTVKYAAADGALLWDRVFDGGFGADEAYAVALDASGNAVVAGYTMGSVNLDFKLLKYAAATGATLWEATSLPLRQRAQMGEAPHGKSALARDAAGNAIVAMRAFNGVNWDMRTVKYAAASGAVIWEKTLNGLVNRDDQPYGLALDASGNVFVTGVSQNGAGSGSMFTTVKYAGVDGATLWTAFFISNLSGDDAALALAVDAAGDAIVAGKVHNGTNYDIRTIKYSGASGSTLWQVTFAGAANLDDVPVAAAVDAAGSVFVTGTSHNGIDEDWVTLKYAAASGALLWQRTFNQLSEAGSDRPTGIAVDAAGNAVVTGMGFGFSGDFLTIKYAALDGATLWYRSMDGPTGTPDVILAAALDGSGNVFVTGFTRALSGLDEFKTIKYAAANGATLWEKTFGAAPGGPSVPYALAVDAAGNAIVAGQFHNGFNNDFKTIKYRGFDGAAMWEHSFNGDLNGNDAPSAVVAAPGGVYVAGNCSDSSAVCVLRIDDGLVQAAADGKGDFNLDHRSDIVWRRTGDGSTALWLMNGFTQIGGAALLPGNTGWTPKLVADFDGDGRADIVWQHIDGRVAMWLMNGAMQAGGGALLPAGTGWSPVLAGDFNGDLKADLVWQHIDGRTSLWLMSGAAQTGGSALIGAGSGWTPRLLGDFNGDGLSDILWHHQDGRASIWLMNGATQLPASAGIMPARTGWSPRLLGDFDGDGRSDILWQHHDGRASMWLMNGATQVGGTALVGAGTGYRVTRVGDANADGRDDIVWQREDGTIAIWLMQGATTLATGRLANPGSAWTVHRMTDFDNDGRADLLVQNPTGEVHMWLMAGTVATTRLILPSSTGWTPAP